MTLKHLSAEEIAAYLDGEGTQEELRAAQVHLESCAECQQSADDQRLIKTLMGSLEEPVLPRSFVITADMVATPVPLSSPGAETSTASAGSSKIVRFEPFAKFLSIAAVIAFLVLGGGQLAGFIGESDSNGNQAMELSETETAQGAFDEQEPALARGEVREQGESAAANAVPLTTDNARVDTQAQATDNGLTPIDITTIGVGIVALASIAGWSLIHYRAGETGTNS